VCAQIRTPLTLYVPGNWNLFTKETDSPLHFFHFWFIFLFPIASTQSSETSEVGSHLLYLSLHFTKQPLPSTHFLSFLFLFLTLDLPLLSTRFEEVTPFYE